MSATDINDWPGHPDADPDCECCLGDGLQADGETPCPCIDARKANFVAQTIPSAPQPEVATQTAQEAVPVDLTYQQKLEALSLRFYQGMLWTPKSGDYYTTSRADLELYRVVAVEGGMVKTQYCDQSKSSAVSSWPEKEFTSEGFGPKRVWVPDFVLSAQPPQPSVSVAEAAVRAPTKSGAPHDLPC